jgi:hypothetical protein
MAKSKPKKRRAPQQSGGQRRPSRRKSRRRGMSEGGGKVKNLMNAAFNNGLSSFAGGGGAVFVNKMIPSTMGKLVKTVIALVGGGIAAAAGKPNTGAAFTGGMLALTFQNGFLNEDAPFADENALAEMPIYLDENDCPMVMQENGNLRYLEEGEVMQLAEAGILELAS